MRVSSGSSGADYEGKTLTQSATATGASPVKGRDWMAIVARYREPSIRRSIIEIIITAIPFVALWVAAWAALSVSYWLTLAIAIPAAAMLVRLFLIQHDCGHYAFFKTRKTNDWIGRVIGVFTMTPYEVWRRNHATHHANSGNLDERGVGDIETWTVKEYLAKPKWRRFMYRVYRSPLVMFGIGPSFVFMLQQRLPVGQMKSGWRPWISAMTNNLAIAVLFGVMMWLIGVVEFLMVHLPIVAIAATIGVFLFYVQHQFEDTFWEESDKWNHQDAALYGSSYLDLPKALSWVTANIGVHHIHHLYSRVPYYRLPELIRDYPELRDVRRITLLRSFSLIKLKLWDTDRKRLISFRQLAQEFQPA